MRYARQTALAEIGKEGQRKLSEAKVLIVGAGGLGSPIALYLTGAGVGTIGIVDDDVVSVSNLQRQILYSEKQQGLPKAECAAERLSALNSEITVRAYRTRLNEKNAEEILSDYDIIIDGCDNFETRYIISDICEKQHKPYIFGAIGEFGGQVAVLCKGRKTYRDLYPDKDAMLAMPRPSNAVIGITPAMTGSMEASETIKLICGYGEPLIDRMWTFDLRDNSFYTIDL